ncbi:universal stress protein [Sulfitobacter sp. HNIBRBA3233]|uniref:universal stress protein n=1 Tax=Sulfitobacter marinivivus TaxID=3158558 RepID=UPI0032DFEB9B
MFKSIIIGYDGSDPAARAIKTGCALANSLGARVEIMHTPRGETVTHAAEVISGVYVGQTAAQADMLREAAEHMAQQAKEIAAEADVKDVEVHIGTGDPAHDIVSRAKAINADLIVTGRRGLGDLGALVLGSTSHQISKLAPCACLTVP